MIGRLALGTAQIGMRYGIANAAGQIGPEEARAIMDDAHGAGVDTLDTAIAYGDSEQVLGRVGLQGWQVVTKLPACPAGRADVGAWVRAEVEASRRRLGVTVLHGVLLHRPAQLLEAGGAGLYRALLALKQEGIVRHTGISVYAPGELDMLCARYDFDLVQLPLNALDGRWAASGWLPRLHGQGVEIHARSVFLQGLLLMPPQRRPAFFARWQPLWMQWDGWLQRTGMSPLQACLHTVLAVPQLHRVVVGVDSLAQWREIAAAARASVTCDTQAPSTLDPTLLNPACWNLN